MIKAAMAATFTITMVNMTKCKQYDNVKEVAHSYKTIENYQLNLLPSATQSFIVSFRSLFS